MSLSLLKKPVFRNYFLADIIAGFGSGLCFVGANWYVLDITGSSVSVGKILSLTILGALLGSPISGTIADRFNRKAVLIWSNWIRGAFLAVMAVFFYLGQFNIGFVYLFGFMNGVGYSIFRPASGALIQELLDKKELIEGNSLIEVSLQVGMFSAGALSGIIYKYYSFGLIIIIDAIAFAVSNLFLMQIYYKKLITEDHGVSFLQQFKNGLSYLFRRPILFWFGISMFLPYIATMGLNVVLPGYVKETLKESSIVFGLADMNYGIGACLSGLLTSIILSRMSKYAAVIVFAFLSFTTVSLLVINPFVIGLYMGVIVFGFCNSAMRIIMNSRIMEMMPESFMGRAMSVWVTLSMLMQIGVSYAVGLTMNGFKANYGFLLLSVIMFSAFFGCLVFYPKLNQGTIAMHKPKKL